MTDKKFTDEEIIEALDLCTQQNGSIPCYDFPCWNDDEQECEGIDYTSILDLINRQKSEIEELKEKLTLDFEKMESEYDGKIKAEAYKEFAERLKEHINNCHSVSDEGEYVCYDCSCANVTHCIDKFVKEMVGEEE